MLKNFDVEKIRQDFPILATKVNDYPLVYLDNAATSQKPISVIDSMNDYYRTANANVHRGVHYLSEKATLQFEKARQKVKAFINAASLEEVIFTKGTTESINLVAQSYGRSQLKPGDEVVISWMEHHSNIIPWQLLCEQTGAVLKVAPINDKGELIFEAFESLLSDKVKIVALSHISNALGTINPIEQCIQAAHKFNIPVLIDGAQAAPHLQIDVQKLECDFYCFSGHKMMGPTGIGVLYGKKALLEKMPPYQGGGEMIKQVSFNNTTYHDLPHKFEAGTPNIAGVIGLGAAIDYLQQLDFASVHDYENRLLNYATEKALEYADLRLIGTAKNKISILSFVLDKAHPHDIGTIVDNYGVAVRTGHHCAMPVMEFFDVPATVRASFAFYNTFEEVDRLFWALDKVYEVFG